MTAQDLETRIDRIESYQAIQQLAMRYARGVDSRNLDAIGQLFSPQTNFGEFGIGHEGARAFYNDTIRAFYRSFHQIVGHVIDPIEGDVARGVVSCRAEHEIGDKWLVVLMLYFDRYVRVEGRWYFLGRRQRFISLTDQNDNPAEVKFNNWPQVNYTLEMPHYDPTFEKFWESWPEDRAKVTSMP